MKKKKKKKKKKMKFRFLDVGGQNSFVVTITFYKVSKTCLCEIQTGAGAKTNNTFSREKKDNKC